MDKFCIKKVETDPKFYVCQIIDGVPKIIIKKSVFGAGHRFIEAHYDYYTARVRLKHYVRKAWVPIDYLPLGVYE